MKKRCRLRLSWTPCGPTVLWLRQLSTHSFHQDQGAEAGWMLENTGLLEMESEDLLILPLLTKCGSPNPGLCSSSQVALRVRPISVAELEEGATLIAHKVDEQVLRASGRRCRVEACSAGLTHQVGQQELYVSLQQPLGGLSTARARSFLLPRSAQEKLRAFGT